MEGNRNGNGGKRRETENTPWGEVDREVTDKLDIYTIKKHAFLVQFKIYIVKWRRREVAGAGAHFSRDSTH